MTKEETAIVNIIRRGVDASRLTHEDVGRALEVTAASATRKLAGQLPISLAEFVRLARVLNLEIRVGETLV